MLELSYFLKEKAPLSLDNFIKLAFCLDGRDKITKVTQYGSRALAWYFLSIDPKSDVGLRFQSLFKNAQQSRKAFRIGKSLTFYSKAMKSLSNKSLSPMQHTLTVMQNFGMAFFSRAKFIHFDAAEAGKKGGYFWFCANICAIILTITALKEDFANEDRLHGLIALEKDKEQLKDLENRLEKIRIGRPKKLLAVIKACCDFTVSSNTKGVRLAERVFGHKINDGLIGSIGVVSASTVLYNFWPNVK